MTFKIDYICDLQHTTLHYKQNMTSSFKKTAKWMRTNKNIIKCKAECNERFRNMYNTKQQAHQEVRNKVQLRIDPGLEGKIKF